MRRQASLPKAMQTIAAHAFCTRASGRFGLKTRCARGFTLVEVLVALSIMAVIALLSWRGIDSMVRAQDATRDYTDQVMTLQTGLAQWQADLDAMMVWPASTTVLTTTTTDQPATLASQRSLAWDGSTLRITRTDAADTAAGLRVVAWTRRPDGRWQRWQSAPVRSQAEWSAAWDAAARWAGGADTDAPGGGAQAVTVAQALQWQLYYYRNNTWSNPLSSESASASATRTLPDGVRLLVTLAPGQALAGPLTIDWVRPDFGSGS